MSVILGLPRRVARKIKTFVIHNRITRELKFRQRIRELRKALRRAKEIRILVGASGTFHEGWIATEEDELNLLDRDSWARLVKPSTVTGINAEHVWEHLTNSEALKAAENCFHFLRPGGHVRCAVPDGLHPSDTYIDWVRPGGNGPGCDDHYALYTSESLSDVFRRAGFTVNILEYYDHEGTFHSVPWDAKDGMVLRSIRYDPQNYEGKFFYTSLILDAIRPDDNVDTQD